MVQEVTSNSHENIYHKPQQSPAMSLPRQELPKQKLPVPLQTTARQWLELGLKPVRRKHFTLLQYHCPARCLSEET